MKQIKGWETKTMLRLFRFKRHEDETWVLLFFFNTKELQKVCDVPWDGLVMKNRTR